MQAFGKPQIDLFASIINKKCEAYCSWKRDPDAKVINAFTIDWSNLKFYAYPPFNIILIAKVLQKIKYDKASGIVVVPLWTSQTWFPVFRSLTTGPYLEFKPDINLLISPCRMQHHSLAAKLTLVAAKLSAKHIGVNVYQKNP